MNPERAVQTIEPRPDESSAIIQVIERAALNPNVDIDKMERLLQMQERIMERNAKTAYAAALAQVQPALPVVDRKGVISVPAKDGKSGHETPYAKWEDINDAIRPVLAAHGFALSFRIGKDADRVVVTGILSHREGHSEETTLSLPMDTTGSKNNVQAIGSSVSYGKRYTAGALLNFTTRGEDNDGADFPGDWISEDQVDDLVALMDEVKANRDKFLNYLRVDTLAHLPKRRFQEAVAALEAKRGKA